MSSQKTFNLSLKLNHQKSNSIFLRLQDPEIPKKHSKKIKNLKIILRSRISPQDPKTFVLTIFATNTAPHSQSTMNHRLLLVESPFQDTVTCQFIERPMDTHHVPSTHIRHNDQVCQKPQLPSLPSRC